MTRIPNDAVRKASPRFQAVFKTLQEVLGILDDRDRFRIAKAYVQKYAPEVYLMETALKGKTIEKWYLDLILTLTRLYDRGHADALGQAETS